MEEDGYSWAEIAAAILPFSEVWPDEDHYFPISETGIDRQHRTRGLLLAAHIHGPKGQIIPGFAMEQDGEEIAFAFLDGGTFELSDDPFSRMQGLAEFCAAIGKDPRPSLVIEDPGDRAPVDGRATQGAPPPPVSSHVRL